MKQSGDHDSPRAAAPKGAAAARPAPPKSGKAPQPEKPSGTPPTPRPQQQNGGGAPSQGAAAAPSPEAAKKAASAALGKLTTIVELSDRVRSASANEFPFIFVNATRQLFPYRQAVFWNWQRGRLRMHTASGLAVADTGSPYAQWMERFARLAGPGLPPDVPAPFDLNALPGRRKRDERWIGQWNEWLPQHGLWRQFRNRRGAVLGALALFRDDPFAEGEVRLLSSLLGNYEQALAAVSPGRRRGHPRLRRGLWVLALAGIAAAGFIPVRNSSLAPAEVVAEKPEIIRSTLDGVVERLWVEPNQQVRQGDLLLTLDDTQLRTRLLVSRKAEDVTRVEYQQLQQQSLSDPAALPRLPLVRGRLEQLAAETQYIESLLQRVRITSPIDGVVLSDNPDEWLRHPVAVGQKILLVADPERVELEITLPMGESLDLQVGDTVLFYLNSAPTKPVEAVITFVGFRAQELPGVGMAFRLRAAFPAGEQPMLGRRGMTKLYGQEQNLAAVVLRRPLLAVRQWLGW